MAGGVTGTGGELVVRAERLGKAFGRSTVLRDVTLSVRAGETVALFGPNGAGKSTLLRLCATLMAPTAGSLQLFGAAARSGPVRQRIGLLAHQSFLYPDLTARENLEFYARLHGLRDGAALADAWLRRAALVETADRPVRLFSRGMEQRIALARALLHDPELVLLDEPWSGLDAAAADWLGGLLAELRTRGRTILVSTHDFARGLDIADRAMILHRGRLAWEAPVDGTSPSAVDATYRELTGVAA